jgi:hypothetical protein
VRRKRASTLLAFCLVVGMLVAPAAANAQTSATSQYVPNVGTAGSTATGGSGGNNGGAAGQPNNGAAGGAVSGGSGGSLPFTGYPLTPLVLIVAMLLAAGLALRMVVPRLDRRA